MPDHVVYRLWRSDGRLLYVGVTSNLPNRLHRHAMSWGLVDVVGITTEPHPTREAAAAAEVRAIFTEHPLWNRLHNPTPSGTVYWRQIRPPLPQTVADYERWCAGEPVERGGYLIEPPTAA